MDYPNSVPNVGLVGGKFVDENTSTGQVGSLIPSAWGSAVTDEIINVIKAAGFIPKENENNQLAAAIKEIVKQGMRVPLGVGFNFYNSDLTSLYYRTGHDASMWSLIVRLAEGSELSAFNVGRATGKVSFSVRPAFAGNTPWDSGNFDPSRYMPVSGGAYYPKYLGVSFNSEVSGYGSLGGYIGWGSAGTGTMQFICNKGGGNTGGFVWGTVGADNQTLGPLMSYSSAGRLTVPMEIYVPAIPSNTVVPTQGAGYAGPYIANCAFVQATLDAKLGLATETSQGTVRVATDAQMLESNDQVIVTPKKMRKGFAFSFQPNGYFAFPSWLGGLVIQWGNSAAIPVDNRLTVSYQIEFPSTCFIALANYKSNAAFTNHCQSFGVANIGKASFQIENQWVYGDTANAFSGVWLAIGY